MSRPMLLQAVVVADSYNKRFEPLTQQTPRALLPLCNVPLIDYVLKFLHSNDIQDVVVVVRAHADQIQEHLEHARSQFKSMKLTCVVSQGSHNFGDALRDLETRKIINSHFILVTSDIVSNYDLRPVIEEHIARADKDKDCLMTMLMTQCDHEHPVRSIEEDTFVVVDSEDNRLLYLDSPEDGHIRVPLDRVMERKQVQLRYDLVQSHIFICTPLMLMQFHDNFDYASVFDLIRGVIDNEDIVGYKIHTAVSPKFYATRCANLTSYDAMTQDLMNRWTYPLVPDMFAPSHDELYQYKRSNIYLQPGCILGRRCKLLGSVVLGPGCVVGEGDGAETTLRGTVLGRNCTVGCGVRLRNAYVLDGSTIGNNCSVDHALIGRNVKICDGVVIPHGCVIDDGVEIGPNITLPKHIRVSLTRSEPLHNEPEPLEIFADEALVFRPRDLTALPEVTEDEEEETDDVEDAEEELFDGDLEAEPESGTGMEDTLAPDESDQADEDNAGDGEEEEDEEEAGEGSTEDTEQQEESEQYDVEFVGEAGRGFRFILRPDFEDSVEAMYWKEPKRAPPPPAVFPSALTRAMSLSSELPESPEDEDVDSLLGDADVVEPLIDLDQEFEEFYSDVLELIQQRVKPDNVKGAPFSAIQVEITGSRAAHNMDHSDVCCAIVRAIITSADRVPRAKCERYLAQLTAAMSPFLQNYVETDMDQHVCIENVWEFCMENEHSRHCFKTLLFTLYDREVLDEDAILQWFEGFNPGEGASPAEKSLYDQAKQFVTWLEEAEEESD